MNSIFDGLGTSSVVERIDVVKMGRRSVSSEKLHNFLDPFVIFSSFSQVVGSLIQLRLLVGDVNESCEK